MAEYSFLDRLLHRLALQLVPVAELSFDLDQQTVRTEPDAIVHERHVFVSGLARAGTTILMRRFHASGLYRSLTYRDMPFVLAPNLWRKLTRTAQRNVAAAERAHGDRIVVDVDSPESLDEVFWRIFAGDEYIAKTCLKPHQPDAETRRQFVRYVNAILNAQDEPVPRYLSKNNNNVLRLGCIRQAFPQALILVPFREPLAHASSLLRQHRNFSQSQKADPFVRSYMRWLVHHEFGLDLRPFRFDSTDRTSGCEPDSIEFWLQRWTATYGWLECSAPDGVTFVCYEDLCQRPAVWKRLADMAGIAGTGAEGEAFRLSEAAVEKPQDATTLEAASALYHRLADRARAALH